jgi:tetratricopeptide (TPR) repeat protein
VLIGLACRIVSQLRSVLLCAVVVGAILVGALTSSARAEQGAEPSAQSLYERGVVERRAGRSDVAMVLLALAAAHEPDNADFRLQLALALMATSRIDAAQRELRRALRLAPDYPDAEIALGYIDLFLGRRQLGEARARQLLRRYPEREDVLLFAEHAKAPVHPARLVSSSGRAIALRLSRFDGSVTYGRLPTDLLRGSYGGAARRDNDVRLAAAVDLVTSVRLQTR